MAREAEVLRDAIVEARRRAERADRDVSAVVEHYTANLPAVCAHWRLRPTGWFGNGSGAPTVAVLTEAGQAAVLKVSKGLKTAARVMAAAAGRGYVRVLRWDFDRGAVLMERLGDDLASSTTRLVDQAGVVVPLLREAWTVPLATGDPFPRKAAGLQRILEDLGPRYGTGHPAALALAKGLAAELATSERAQVVCHGDPHPGNVLRRGSGWALVDPDGFVGERAYDLGVALRDGHLEIWASERLAAGSGPALVRLAAARLAELAGEDTHRVWSWGFVERVTSGLYLNWHGYQEEGANFLDTAELISGSGGGAKRSP